MFNFSNFMDSSKSPSLSPEKNQRGQESPDSQAVPFSLPMKKERKGPPAGSLLTLKVAEDEDDEDSPRLMPPPQVPMREEKKKRPVMAPLTIDDSQEEEDRDFDG